MARSTSRKRRTRQRTNYLPWIIGAVVVALILVAILVRLNSSPTPVAASALDSCGQPACGAANAPVTIEEYADFQ